MINSLLPSRARRVAGTLLLSSVIVVCSCSAWAGQSSAPDTPEPAGRTLQVSAEHAQYAAGVYHYSGKVVVTVATAAGPLTVSSKQMEQRSDGSLVLSGEVRFEMAGSILYSDRAVIRRNGIIEMEHVDVTRTSEY